ncbi:fibronectin type III domain-containing protein [Pectinatus sottacetonis]|uniref:fibronectin type III domain-containing protein n=1 Tax=Pectinatus sottacetonis TaxID=1002795 RepID=UPI0018C78508|nr:fibronectin type III domain-containing protein [Pectinatus sottacetonis]
MKKVICGLLLFTTVISIVFVLVNCKAYGKIPSPTGLKIPVLSCSSHSIWLIWNRSDNSQIAYYNIYVDNKKVGNTKNLSAEIGIKHIQKFQSENRKLAKNLISFHSFNVENLQPDTDYYFKVSAVDINGRESVVSVAVKGHTPSNEKNVIKITDFGAIGDGITVNTTALQKAINACPFAGTLEIPRGSFVTGSVNLKSDMTLQLDQGAVLIGSGKASDYILKKNNHYTGMLNADSISNIRIIGKGTISGNGWRKDNTGHYYLKANNKSDENVLNIGILAKAQTESLLNKKYDFKTAYNSRSSVLVFHNVHNIYLAGITLTNPSMHMIVANNCNNMRLNNVKVMTYNCNNGDGIDFSGTDLLIANSYFD